MIKLASANQMTTPMKLLKAKANNKMGVSVKEYEELDTIFVNFKTFGGTESVSNDVLSVIDTAQITTWFRPDITSDCRLRRLSDNAEYDILGEPENLEQRNMLLTFKIRRVKGEA